VVQLRVPEATLAMIDEARGGQSRSGWLLDLAERELAGDGRPDDGRASAAALPAAREVPAAGIPSPGVACSWPSCWARDTARYGVTDPAELYRTDFRDRPRDPERCGVTFCPAHAARLSGFRYVRPHAPLPRASARAAGPA